MHRSQLCDSSLVAYLAYLAVVSCDGESAGDRVWQSGGDGVDESGGCGNNYGGGVVSVFAGLLAEARGALGDLGDGVTDRCIGGGVHRLIGDSPERGSRVNVGLASCDDGDSVGGLDSGVGAECDGKVNTEHESAEATRQGAQKRVDADALGSEKGANWERNRAWKEKKRAAKARKSVPVWRVGARPVSDAPSLTASVVTVDSKTAEEIEAARTLAVRRTFENKLAVMRAKHQLASYADKDKTAAIKRLEVARIEERINTTKAKSQASYKKCDTPLNSVGSAGSAGEFAWKQEIRKRDAVIKERDYYEQQLEVAMKYLSDAGKRAVAELPEPYIPTLEDIEFEDADISPYYSREEMEAEAAKWVGDEAW